MYRYDEFDHAGVAIGYYAVLFVWTLATLPRVQNAAACTKRFLAVDLAVALTGILLTFFSTLFLLYDGRRIWEWFLKLVPAAARPGVAGAGPRAWRTLTAYVRGTVLVAFIDAVFIGLGIYFLDVPMAVPLAVFIFLFSFIPLVGAVDWETRSNQRVLLARRSGLHVARIDHLLGRYGGLIDEVLDLIQERPELAGTIPGAAPYLAAEVVYAVTHEGARHLDDVLARRTRISIEMFDRGLAAARPVAELMGGPLGWDAARVDEEVDHYLRRVEAERQSQLQTSDQAADEARVSAPEGPWAV